MNDCPECKRKDNCKINIKNGKCLNYITDDISTASHRFYRGLLLPAITEAMGESNNQYVHDFILKPEWIYRQTGEYYIKVDDYDEIPAKHQPSARIISEVIEMTNGETYEHYDKLYIIGYVPSMAKFTKKETMDYFKFCETLLEEIGGQIPTADNQEYIQLRAQLKI